MITELTPEQEKLIGKYVKKGLELGLETQPDGILDKQSVIDSVNKLYKAYNYKEPTVYFEPSPLAGRKKVDSLLNQTTEWKWDYMAGSQELYWLYFYKYINDELPVKRFDGPLDETVELMEKVGWVFPYQEFIVITPKPAKLHMVNERLHNPNGPAVEFTDGYKLYAMNGVRFTNMEEWIETPADKLDYDKVLQIKNVEQRAEVIKKIGIDKLFDKLGPTVIDKKGDYVLYSVPVYQDMPRLYLKMENPSVPGDTPIEAVHPDCKTVDSALNFRNFGTILNDGEKFIPPVILT